MLAAWILPHLFQTFAETHPSLHIQVTDLQYEEVVLAVDAVHSQSKLTIKARQLGNNFIDIAISKSQFFIFRDF